MRDYMSYIGIFSTCGWKSIMYDWFVPSLIKGKQLQNISCFQSRRSMNLVHLWDKGVVSMQCDKLSYILTTDLCFSYSFVEVNTSTVSICDYCCHQSFEKQHSLCSSIFQISCITSRKLSISTMIQFLVKTVWIIAIIGLELQ